MGDSTRTDTTVHIFHKIETAEDRATVTINGLYKVIYELSIVTKMLDLE